MLQPAERTDARANRARLIVAAMAVFAERGTGAEIKEIAERAGLAVGTVYNHFPGKRELIDAIVAEAIHEFERALDNALRHDDPIAGVRAFVAGGLKVVDRYGELMTAMLEGRAPEARDAAVDQYRRGAFRQRITVLVTRGIEAGAFRPNLNPEVAAAVLKAIFVPWSLAELRDTQSPEQIADTFVDLFVTGAGTVRH